MQFQEKSTQCKNNSHSQFDLRGRRHYFLDDRHVPCPSFDGAANLPWGKWLGEGDYLAFHNYQECLSVWVPCCRSFIWRRTTTRLSSHTRPSRMPSMSLLRSTSGLLYCAKGSGHIFMGLGTWPSSSGTSCMSMKMRWRLAWRRPCLSFGRSPPQIFLLFAKPYAGK